MTDYRNRITVFGKRYTLIEVVENVAEQPLILYRDHSQGKDWKPKVCTAHDWVEWDKNARRAK